MKHQLFIGILFILALSACAKVPKPVEVKAPEPVEGPTSELSVLDSLMWQQPDSALMRLLSYFDTCRDVSRNVSENASHDVLGDVSGNVSTTYNHHYANLLLSELLYKNDYAQTNRAELLQAVAYYDSLVAAERLVRTHAVCPYGAATVGTHRMRPSSRPLLSPSWTPAPIILMGWGITSRTASCPPARNTWKPLANGACWIS